MNLPPESPGEQRHRAEHAAGPKQCAELTPDTVEINSRQSDQLIRAPVSLSSPSPLSSARRRP